MLFRQLRYSRLVLQQIALAPDNAVNRLARRASDGADGEGFGRLLGRAVVACRHALFDDLNLAVEASCSAFNQGHICGEAHFIDMSSRLQIIQCIEYNAKLSKPCNGKVVIFNVGMMGDDFDIWIELFGSFLCDLWIC